MPTAVWKTVRPRRLSVARFLARSMYRWVVTRFSLPSEVLRTQPVVLFGRIGSRTRYHVSLELMSRPSSASTRFCVLSPVFVPSLVTTRAESFGCARTTARLNTYAQWPSFAVASVYECCFTLITYLTLG